MASRPELTGRPTALFVAGRLGEQWAGMVRAWVRRLNQFEAAGWQVHVATVLDYKDFDETPQAWRDRGWLAEQTQIHHYRLRDRRVRSQWTRGTEDHFARDERVATWLDWLVGLLPGAVVFADSPVTYAPVALMANPHVTKVMTLHLSHRTSVRGRAVPVIAGSEDPDPSPLPGTHRRSYKGVPGQPKLSSRFLPFAGAADVVVVPTALQAKHLREDVPGLHVRHIPNMVEPGVVDAVSRDPDLVVSLGRLDPLKRIDHVIRAVDIVRRSRPTVRLEVFGRGPDLPRLREITEDLGLGGTVSFPGYVEDARRVLAGAALSVHASRREAFGLSVAESLAVGTPVVSYDVDYGPSELVTDGVNGRLVPSGSVRALARGIGALLDDVAGRERMGVAATRSVQALHPGIVGTQWLELAGGLADSFVPTSELLVEDIVAGAEGVRIVGVAHGATPDRSSVRLGGGQAPAPAPARGSLPVHEFDLDVAWAALADARVGSRLTASSRGGHPLPVVAVDPPTTLLPAPGGPILLGFGDGGLQRLPDAPNPVVRFMLSRAQYSEGALWTDLSRAVSVTARFTSANSLRVDMDQPGIAVRVGSRLVIVDSAPFATRRILATVVLGGGDWESGYWQCSGRIEWDTAAVVDLLARGSRPITLRLSLQRRGVVMGRLEVPGRWPLRMPAQSGALLVRARSGNALLAAAPRWSQRLLWALRHARV